MIMMVVVINIIIIIIKVLCSCWSMMIIIILSSEVSFESFLREIFITRFKEESLLRFFTFFGGVKLSWVCWVGGYLSLKFSFVFVLMLIINSQSVNQSKGLESNIEIL